MKPEPIWRLAAQLGEGPIWNDESQSLWFTDIKSCQIHCYKPAAGEHQSHETPGEVGFVIPGAAGSLLLGMGRGLYLRDSGGVISLLAEVPTASGNRINDGTAGPDGRVWFGTMDNAETAATGEIMMYDGVLHRVWGGCCITNGPAISADGKLIYHVDTLARQIWRAEIHDDGTLAPSTRFAAIAPGDGTPDGVVVDAEGGLWVGLWGGFALRRYSARGAITHQIALPCANITKVAFGGPDLRTGYITTARVGLDAAALAEQKLAGALFAFEAPIPGLPGPVFKP